MEFLAVFDMRQCIYTLPRSPALTQEEEEEGVQNLETWHVWLHNKLRAIWDGEFKFHN